VTIPYVVYVMIKYVVCVTIPYVVYVMINYVVCVTIPYVVYVMINYVVRVTIPYVVYVMINYVVCVTIHYTVHVMIPCGVYVIAPRLMRTVLATVFLYIYTNTHYRGTSHVTSFTRLFKEVISATSKQEDLSVGNA
jgi:hypothetical protein